MRGLITIIVLLLCSYSVAQNDYVVMARNGLNVRSDSSLKANKIAKLPYGVIVKKLENTNKKITIQDGAGMIEGTWVRVWYNNYTYFVSDKKEDFEGEGYVLDSYLKKVRDDSLVTTTIINQEFYNTLKEKTIDLQYKPKKISNLDSIKTILKGRVEWGNQYENYSFENTVKSIITSNGQKLIINQRQNEFGFYQDFCGYYPEEEILLMEGGHSSDVAFSIRTGEMETTGNPEYIIPSPRRTIRLNGLHSGQECMRYFFQKKTNGGYEYFTEFNAEPFVCVFEDFCWTNENSFIYSTMDYSQDTKYGKPLYFKGSIKVSEN